jgi:hypothetical protein
MKGQTDTELQIIMVSSDFSSITSRHRRNTPEGSTKRPNHVRLLASNFFFFFMLHSMTLGHRDGSFYFSFRVWTLYTDCAPSRQTEFDSDIEVTNQFTLQLKESMTRKWWLARSPSAPRTTLSAYFRWNKFIEYVKMTRGGKEQN